MADDSYLRKCGVDPSLFTAEGEPWRAGGIVLSSPLTNGAALELAELKAKSKNTTWKTVVEWLSAILGDDWPGQCLPQTLSSIIARMKRELQSFRTLPLGKKAKTIEFMNAVFLPAVTRKSASAAPETEESDVSHGIELSACTTGTTPPPPKTRKCEGGGVESELHLSSISKLEQEKLTLKQKMCRQAENLNWKLKRRESGLDTVTSEVEALHARLAILNEELRVTQAASIELQLKNRRLERNIWAAKRRASETLARQSAMYTSSVNALCAFTDEEDIDSLRQENRYLQNLVARLENDLLLMQEERDKIDEPGTVETFDTSGGSFKPFVREACMTLLSHHVALEHVGQVIRSVVKSFTGREVGRLPIIGLLSQMQSEMKTVSLVHAAKQITESSYSTLHTDATTKFFRKYSAIKSPRRKEH